MVLPSAFENAVLIDSSAVIALHDSGERFHAEAVALFSAAADFVWFALDVTSHETFTIARSRHSFPAAWERYRFLRGDYDIHLARFTDADEQEAERILQRYSDHSLSFHDALCAASMKRMGIAKVFTFDRDFLVMGFEVLPGTLS